MPQTAKRALAMLTTAALLTLLTALATAQSGTVPKQLDPPPQDQGLPYTRSARSVALAKIKNQIGVFAGSRYAYVKGYKVRLDDTNLLRGDALLQDGQIYVPSVFAGILTLKEITPDKAPNYLADRWVYTLNRPDYTPSAGVRTIQVKGKPWVALADVARQRGLKVYQHPRGLLLIGETEIGFGKDEQPLLDSVIALFDTPEKYADPAIAARYIPRLKAQGMWTEHATATPEQLKTLAGPEAEWPETPRNEYDFTGFNRTLLGSKVPAPGIYPRLLFSPEDLPALRQRIKASKVMQMSMIEIETLLKKSWWDPATPVGRDFLKLAHGENVTPSGGIYNSHINYPTNCLVTMALYCMLTGDDAHGKLAADALYNYYKFLEPKIDEQLATSDSEFGSTVDGAYSSSTQWRGMHGLVAHMDLPFALDFGGKWMSAGQKDLLRRVIAKATYGRRTGGGDGPRRAWRDINHVTWHLTHYLAVASIEGLEGFDPEACASGAELARDFLEWGIDKNGEMFEGNGKNGGGLQFEILTMIALARRGDNLWGHPHLRKMLAAQVYTTAPNGKATLSSGTWGGGAMEKESVLEIRSFYPGDKAADYLLTQGFPSLDPATLDLEAYRAKVEKNHQQLRLPGPTYCGMTRGFLFDSDWQPTSRAELKLPLDWSTPVHGILSTASDATPDATWLCLYVRANHYIGAGHHHADVGMFYMSGLGVNWVTESPFIKSYDGRFHNEVLIDGRAEPNGSPAHGKYLGATLAPQGALGAADLSYAYSWRWNTQVDSWTRNNLGNEDETQDTRWEVEPDPEILKIFTGTDRYKMRIWWPTSNYANWLPTLRTSWNPVRYALRSAGVVRGNHPYAVVVDDVKKDDQPHLYQWTVMLGSGVWQADVKGLTDGQLALGWRDSHKAGQEERLKTAAGEPLLLVCALEPAANGDSSLPLIKVETAADGFSDPGKPKAPYDRLAINFRGTQMNAKVLMIPVRHGEPFPRVSFDAARGVAHVAWRDQTDELRFTQGSGGRTSLAVSRDGQEILKSRLQ